MQVSIKIDEARFKDIQRIAKVQPNRRTDTVEQLIANGTPLPKGHGRLIDEKVAYRKFYSRCYAKIAKEVFIDVPTIIEADKEYEAEVITRGKCMMCGKELTEGLFFCKECGDKANSEK